jgi:hypothetical protein
MSELNEFYTTPAETPETQALRGHFIAPGEQSTHELEQVTAADIAKFRRIFTLASEDHMAWRGQHEFSHGFSIPNLMQDRMVTKLPRMGVWLKLELPMPGADKYQEAKLQLEMPLNDRRFPGRMNMRIEADYDKAGSYKMLISDYFDRESTEAKLDSPVEWGEPSAVRNSYVFNPTSDTSWRKVSRKTYALQKRWHSSQVNGQFGHYGRTMDVVEDNVPMTAEEQARATKMYDYFWDVMGRLEKLADSKPASEYATKRAGQVAAGAANIGQKIFGSLAENLEDRKRRKDYQKMLGSMIHFAPTRPTLYMDNAEHRALYETLLPTGPLPEDPADSAKIRSTVVELDNIDDLF